MAIVAYGKSYLQEAQHQLGLFFDLFFSIGVPVDVAARYLIMSGYAEDIEMGNGHVISGMSAPEIIQSILEEDGLMAPQFEYKDYLSPEYWLGFSVSYYQWKSRLSFKEIFNKVPASKILTFYNPYHEMDITSFCDLMDEMLERVEAPLKKIRVAQGMSQSSLAIISEVPIRTIQQYEQKRKDISKASFETVYSLAKALLVDPIQLIP